MAAWEAVWKAWETWETWEAWEAWEAFMLLKLLITASQKLLLVNQASLKQALLRAGELFTEA